MKKAYIDLEGKFHATMPKNKLLCLDLFIKRAKGQKRYLLKKKKEIISIQSKI